MYIYGRNAVKEHLKEHKSVKEVILQEGFHDDSVLSLLPADCVIKTMTRGELTRLLGGVKAHQGIAILTADFRFTDLELLIRGLDLRNDPVLLLLDNIQDPRNLGAIVRTCEALDVKGVIIPKHRSASISPSAIKASAGAIGRVPICRVTNVTQTLEYLKKHGFWVVSSCFQGAVDYRSLAYDFPLVLVMGNEGSGITPLVLKHSDFKITLPMLGKISSLNVSVAAGVLLYQIYNKRHPYKE